MYSGFWKGLFGRGSTLVSNSITVVWLVIGFIPRVFEFAFFIAPWHLFTSALADDWLGFSAGVGVGTILSFFVIIPMSIVFNQHGQFICFPYVMFIAWLGGNIITAIIVVHNVVTPIWKHIRLGRSLSYYHNISITGRVGLIIGLSFSFPYAALRTIPVPNVADVSYQICDPSGTGVSVWVFVLIALLAGTMNGAMGPTNNFSFEQSRRVCGSTGSDDEFEFNNEQKDNPSSKSNIRDVEQQYVEMQPEIELSDLVAEEEEQEQERVVFSSASVYSPQLVCNDTLLSQTEMQHGSRPASSFSRVHNAV